MGKTAPFLICATPRSGTAWLSNFLTYDGCFCAHEPMAGGFARPDGYRLVGGIDTGAGWVIDDIRGLWPELRIYTLTRNADDVHASLARLGLSGELPPLEGQFRYERLFNVDYLADLWAEVVGTPFDRVRAGMLAEMNVQRSIDALRSRLGDR